jgi:hypothetical protein
MRAKPQSVAQSRQLTKRIEKGREINMKNEQEHSEHTHK